MAVKEIMLSVKIDAEVLDSLRNVVYWKPGVTLNLYVEDALKEALDKEPVIIKRPGELKRGRPVR